MTNYLIRRFFQMIIVVLMSAVVSYALLNLAPGGPLTGLRQMQQNAKTRMTEDDISRIRAYFELDLYLPIRFSRWFIGWPRGPIEIGGTQLFASVPVGCYRELQAMVMDSRGNVSLRVIECTQHSYLADLADRRASGGVMFGDFGNSWKLSRDRPVSNLLESRIGNTLQLMGFSTLIALMVGLPLGVYSAVKQYSRFDYFFTTLAFMGTAMPTFFFGILAILVFSIIPNRLGWFHLPPGSSVAVRDYLVPGIGMIDAGSAMDRLLHTILPVGVLAIVNIAFWSRYVRASMLEVLRQDYVRTARAKGLVERMVIMKHALRNALIPFVTLVVFTLPGLVGGAIITETIFSWPGMGRLYFLALGESDYPVAMAILFIIAILTVIATLLRDVLYTIVDPRIRFS
jgi:peptide/nickel transport system permease protein